MNWTTAIVIGLALVAVVAMKRMSFVSAVVARKHLVSGGLVVDVRSPQEFSFDHVLGAVNIPLGELREDLPRRVPDKTRVLLVHCLSGGRSAIAKQQLKGMGYELVFNLGSLARAKRIVAESQVTRTQTDS